MRLHQLRHVLLFRYPSLWLGGCLLLTAQLQVNAESAPAPPAGAAAQVTVRANSLDFTLPRRAGGHWRLAEQRGRTVWLALVAPWCGSCDGFVAEVDRRLQQPGSATAEPGSDSAASVFMVVSAVDARGSALSLAAPASARELIDASGAVLRNLDPDDLPWLVRIDEDGVLVAAGADLDALAPVLQEPGLLSSLRARWRQVFDE